VREVWTLEYRLRGDAHLAGGFRIAPGHYAYVTPSTMRVDNGLLSFGDHDFIRGGSWAAEVRVEPFAAGGVHGIEILRYMDIVLHQHDGTVALASLGDVYLPPGTSLEGGGGALAIDAHLDHGIVRAESRVTYQSHDVGVRSAWFAGRGDVDFVANVDEGEGGPRVVARARTEHAALTPATDLRELRGNIVFRGIDVTAPIVVTRLEGGYASAHTPDLRAWQPAADRAVVFEGGAVTSTAHAVLGEGGTLEGHIESTLDNIAMAIGPFSFVSSGTTSTRVVSDDLSKWIAFPAARVDVHDVAVRLLNGHSRGMWVRARSADTRIATSGATATDSTIDVTAGPGEQAVQLFTRLASLPDVAADVTHGTQLEAALHLRVRQGEISLGILRAHDGALDGRGRVRKRVGQAPSGAFLLSVGPVFAGLDIERGNVSIRPLATSSWLAETLAKR
jgi:hypothetical protein